MGEAKDATSLENMKSTLDYIKKCNDLRKQNIDEYKKAGRKIPAEWIKNPFYLKYYREKGMLRESTPGEKK